tara:strand:+ start:635 stop:1027 length:393 start_codon:yes stop_codon:yes gene_type:complete
MKYRLELKGLAGSCNDQNGNDVDLQLVDGLVYQGDVFSEYLDDDLKKLVIGGTMEFEIENNQLYTIVNYEVDEILSEEDLQELIEFTQGQLSDGIGKVFEQFPCIEFGNELEVYLSPWFHGQKLKANYYD